MEKKSKLQHNIKVRFLHWLKNDSLIQGSGPGRWPKISIPPPHPLKQGQHNSAQWATERRQQVGSWVRSIVYVYEFSKNE